jgi:hypothetical protein
MADSRIARQEITCIEVTWRLIIVFLKKNQHQTVSYTVLIQCLLSVLGFLKVISILIFKSNFVFYATDPIDCILMYYINSILCVAPIM